jgi:hypothetical protein
MLWCGVGSCNLDIGVFAVGTLYMKPGRRPYVKKKDNSFLRHIWNSYMLKLLVRMWQHI